jgi:hypothetical protein
MDTVLLNYGALGAICLILIGAIYRLWGAYEKLREEKDKQIKDQSEQTTAALVKFSEAVIGITASLNALRNEVISKIDIQAILCDALEKAHGKDGGH